MPTVSITRLRVRKLRYLLSFLVWAVRATRQARRAPGNISVGLLRDRNNTYWTKTVWKDDASMNAFMMSEPHRAAMPKLLEWCDEASLVRWSQDGVEPPLWTDAHRRLEAEGRLSKVNHPTEAHRRLKFPPPRG